MMNCNRNMRSFIELSEAMSSTDHGCHFGKGCLQGIYHTLLQNSPKYESFSGSKIKADVLKHRRVSGSQPDHTKDNYYSRP